MKELLIKLGASKSFKDWAANKSWKEIYETCPRGNWLCWLFLEVNPKDTNLLRLTAAHCANTVRDKMKDDRSKALIDAIIDAKGGKVDDKLIRDAHDAAHDAYTAYSAAYDAYTAYDPYTAYAAHDAYVAYGAAYAAAYDAAARKKNQQETADICRKHLPIEIWNVP